MKKRKARHLKALQSAAAHEHELGFAPHTDPDVDAACEFCHPPYDPSRARVENRVALRHYLADLAEAAQRKPGPTVRVRRPTFSDEPPTLEFCDRAGHVLWSDRDLGPTPRLTEQSQG